jgi:tight adherence protein C
MNLLLVGAAAVTSLGIALVAVSAFVFANVAATPGSTPSAYRSDLEAPLYERLLHPIGVFARRLWVAMTPMFAQSYIERQLDAAGHPGHLARNGFMFIQLGVGALLWLIAIVIGVATGSIVLGLLLVIVATPIGLVLTYGALAARVRDRQNEILRSLPDLLDLVAVGTEAGQPLNAVLGRVRLAFQDALGEELGRALREADLGVPRARALNDMAERTGLAEIHAFAQALIQSQQLGVGLASLMRLQAEDQRRERQQRLQEDAARTGLLILFPTAGCIFPALYVVILGPAGLILLHFAGH